MVELSQILIKDLISGMNNSAVIRILDANLNRLAEGLRVLEEAARMILDDAELTGRLKALRHDLIRGDLPFNLELLQSRDSTEDVGADLEVDGEAREKDLALIIVANSRRAQESLRVLEELAKLPEFIAKLDSNKFKQARFELYTLEKDLVFRLTRQARIKKISGLYAVIDTQILGNSDPLEAAGGIIEAGVKIIQLRAKTMSKNRLLPVARDLQALCRLHGVLFIVNDYLDIALAIEADGLHIGQEDLPVETARRLLPLNAILGVSAATPEEVRSAEKAGADYLGVGAIFSTFSKDDIKVVGLERLRVIRPITHLPLVAIGGINKENVKSVMGAGADSVCLISAILGSDDITLAAREVIQIIEDKNEKTD
jgi:thiamine-phosphate pyrophosphorylase